MAEKIATIQFQSAAQSSPLNIDSFSAAARPIDGPHGLRDAVAAEREK
jgi:hypothetical protein